MPQPSYASRVRQKQQLHQISARSDGETCMETKDQQMERIYFANYKPAVLVQVKPNPNYSPRRRRRQLIGSMPTARGRFQYTCDAYGQLKSDYVTKQQTYATKGKKKKPVRKEDDVEHREVREKEDKKELENEQESNNEDILNGNQSESTDSSSIIYVFKGNDIKGIIFSDAVRKVNP